MIIIAVSTEFGFWSRYIQSFKVNFQNCPATQEVLTSFFDAETEILRSLIACLSQGAMKNQNPELFDDEAPCHFFPSIYSPTNQDNFEIICRHWKLGNSLSLYRVRNNQIFQMRDNSDVNI